MGNAGYECVARPTHLPRLQGVTYLARRRELAARGAPERPLNAGQLGPCGLSKQGEIMPEDEQRRELLEHTTRIVAAHVANNAMPAVDLPRLIAAVHETLATLGPEAKPTPVVPIKQSVKPEYVVCLEDGKKQKMLKRHAKPKK